MKVLLYHMLVLLRVDEELRNKRYNVNIFIFLLERVLYLVIYYDYYKYFARLI